MSDSIAFTHPSLVLGQLADTKLMEQVARMGHIARQTDAAHQRLNALIRMKHSLMMTLNELHGMGTPLDTLPEKLTEVDQQLREAATAYLNTYLNNENQLFQLQSALASEASVSTLPETPLKLEETTLKAHPWHTASLKLDSHYFSRGGGTKEDMVAQLGNFVRKSGGAGSEQLARDASEQTTRQAESHRLYGTLVVTAQCTHRNIGVIEPQVIDPVKAVNAWNTLYPHARIESPKEEAKSPGPSTSDEALTLLTGAVYGSSFVGMVHLMQEEGTPVKDFESNRARLEEKLRIGGWLQARTGKLGVDPEILDEVKSFLILPTVTAHLSVMTMGTIPLIGSGKSSKVMDIHSLIAALDNYLAEVNGYHQEAGRDVAQGIPIGYYTRKLTRGDIVRLSYPPEDTNSTKK